MRIHSAHSRSRVLIFIAALVALAILPAGASAQPKKVQFRFGSTAYSVTEANTTFNVTVLRTGNTRNSASVKYDVDPATTATGYSLNPAAGSTLTFAPGETQKTIAVTITDNSTFDPPNKKVVLKLSNPSPGASIPNGQSKTTLTIIDNDGPGTIDLSSASYSVVEGAGVATITVTRNGNPMLIESVDYATSDGTASAGSDYTASSGTLTFGVGETSKTFSVPIADDQDFEGDESLSLTLSNAVNLSNPTDPSQQPTLGPNTPATLTIADDDVPTFSFSTPTYSANENDGTATITVTRGGATYVPASIDYSDAGGGTAATPADYTVTAGTLNFAAGETSKTFAVDVVDDSANEGNETVNLQLTDGSTQVDTAQLSIVDDDNPLPSVQFSSPTYSANEEATTATVTVTLSHAVDGDVTVDYATSDDTATNGTTATDGTADYVDTHGTLTFLGNANAPGGNGETSKTITVPLNPDTVVEDDEDFTLTLSNATNTVLGAPGTTTVTVVDDDDFGNLEFSKQRYDVNEAGGHATITVRRVGGSGGTVSVDYATSDGTATTPSDYGDSHGTLTFVPGETSKTFDVPVTWDGRAEGDETVSVVLSNPANGANLGATTAAVLHIADDGASGPVAFSAGSYSVAENGGPATITVTRSGNLGGPVTVDYATSDGTAHAGTDYTESHGTLTFGPGEMSKTFQVPVTDDSVRQGARSVNLTLSNPGGGTAVGTQGTASLDITDNEPVSSASTDRTAPTLKLTAKKLQKALKAKRFTLKVRSNETAKLVVTIKARKSAKGRTLVTVAKASKTEAAGKTVTIKVKLTKNAIAKLRKALAKGKVKIRVTVKGTDAANNSASVTKVFTIR